MTHSEVLNLLLVSGGRISKTFKFGKVAYHSKRKANLVDVTINLYLRDSNKIEFTASGRIWNHIHSDIYCGGQCLDEIAQYVHDKTFLEIYDLHKHWHLNTLNAGTIEQEEYLNDYFKDKKYDYEEACKILREANLYEVEYDGQMYKYGHAWIYRQIPDQDLTRIYNLLKG